MKHQATLYREDPRYIENGISGTRLSTNDAYVDIDDIVVDEIIGSSQAQFEITVTETKDQNGIPLLPILDRDDLYFSFLQAHGYFFAVMEAIWKDTKKTQLKLMLKFDPEENFTRPLIAIYRGNGVFNLTRDFPYKMPRPVAFRSHEKEPRIVPLVQESEKSRKFMLENTADEKSMVVGENVEILTNWRPDLISYGPKK